jgi:hypothetical protein
VSAVTGDLGRHAGEQLRRDGRCKQDMPDPAWCAKCICGVRTPLPDSDVPEHFGQTSLLDGDDVYPAAPGETVTANYAARCRCRPGCLAIISRGDAIVRVPSGWALLEHSESAA